MGYKFYETAAAEGLIDYDSEVQYPFGHGLSYTTFTQTMSELSATDTTFSFDVTVTNTGSVAGKDVVEIFYNPPYLNGGVEKSVANLLDFERPICSSPARARPFSFTFDLEDMAPTTTRMPRPIFWTRGTM